MLNEQTTTPAQEFDPYASASDPVVPNYDLWGKVEINAWACALVKGTGKVPYDSNNPNHKRFTAIDVFIQPLQEIDVKYPKTLEEHWVAEFPEWAKITLPSIKGAGFENIREINGKWAQVARVPNGKKYEKKDKATGQPTGEMADETTFKFTQFFESEDACRAAYLAAGGQPSSNGNGNGNGHNVPTPIVDTDAQERASAYAFLKVIVVNAAKGKAAFADAKTAVTGAIAQYPPVAKFYNGESLEVGQLITEATGLLPF
jgi:hypothetical protein